MLDINIISCVSFLIAAILVKGFASLKIAFRVYKRGNPQHVNMGRYKIRTIRYWVGETVGYFSLACFLIVMYLAQI